jgi:hypothetical protein
MYANKKQKKQIPLCICLFKCELKKKQYSIIDMQDFAESLLHTPALWLSKRDEGIHTLKCFPNLLPFLSKKQLLQPVLHIFHIGERHFWQTLS